MHYINLLFCMYIDDLLVRLRTRTLVVSLAATMWVLSLMRKIWYCLLPLLLRYARCWPYAMFMLQNILNILCLLMLRNSNVGRCEIGDLVT